MELEDHLAEHNPIVFDPDTVLSQALLSQLASTTSVTTQVLCKPFVRAGVVLSDKGLNPISFNRGLLDTGAQGSNFVSSKLLHILPSSHKLATRSTDRIVRLGDARRIVVQSEIQLQISLTDSTGNYHTHTLWYSVPDDLSHDLIIGLIDLVGPFYDIFADAVTSSRSSAISAIGENLTALTATIQSSMQDANHGNTQNLDQQSRAYKLQKRAICASPNTDIFTVVLHNGSTTDILSHPRHGLVYADNRVESQHNALSTMLTKPTPGAVLPP